MQGNQLFYNEEVLKSYEEELLAVLEGQDYMKTLAFAKKMMMGQEIKSNNAIEGIKDDLSVIEEVIRKRKIPIREEEKIRIINLYHGYQYILSHKEINKESLKELYALLSHALLEEKDLRRMGPFYREAPVYILKGSRLDVEPYKGFEHEKLDKTMEQFFCYVNENEESKNTMDVFIKSQIMHFYFVYVHPYFDVNGRTARTLSMWYLLNHQNYPYITFNQAIAFAKREYEETIQKGRVVGDITLFLKYMLKQVEKELEKEYFLHELSKKANASLTKEDLQMILYLLSYGSKTAKDLIMIYHLYNEKRKISEVYDKRIVPLLEKEILISKGETKSYLKSDVPNFFITLHPAFLEVDPAKVKHLKLERFL